MKFILALLFFGAIAACKKDVTEVNVVTGTQENNSTTTPPVVFDQPADSAPHFVNVSYIDLNKIARISRFRSGIGHDYSDDFEFCRSMKHYFDPGIHASDTIHIFSPVSGTVVRMFQEWAGYQLQIKSTLHPAFIFILFHVNTFPGITEGSSFSEGQLIGYHTGSMTMSDIAVAVNTSGDGPKPDTICQRGLRLFSIFNVMSDSLFQVFNSHGINNRTDMIISEAERDTLPLDCNGEYFNGPGALENWKDLY